MKLNLISRVFFLRLDFLNFLAHYESGACITVTFTFSSLYFELLLPPVVSPKLAYQHQQLCCQFLQKNKFLKYLASIFRKCDISNGYVEVQRFDLFFFKKKIVYLFFLNQVFYLHKKNYCISIVNCTVLRKHPKLQQITVTDFDYFLQKT